MYESCRRGRGCRRHDTRTMLLLVDKPCGGVEERCAYCGNIPGGGDIDNTTLIAEVCTLPYAGREAWMGDDDAPGEMLEKGCTYNAPENIGSWCEACVGKGGTADPMTGAALAAQNLFAMGSFDIVALIFAAVFVSFTVIGELKDIRLCAIAIAHADTKLNQGWRLALGFLVWLRRWVFLPSLVMTMPVLVLYKGGDALSICLNTVALLFLCDIDNIAFDLVLGERVRARVEDAGRVELTDLEATALARTKAVHVVLIVLGVLASVGLGEDGTFLAWIALFLGGVVESFVPGAPAAQARKRAATVLAKWLLGFVAFLVLTEAV